MLSGTQKTIKKPVSFSGIGLHSGEIVKVTMRPALPNTGIRFVNPVIDPDTYILAESENVTDVKLAVTLESGKTKISTVEHILSVLYVLGVSNLIIEIDNKEFPIMDGSAKDILENIIAAGVQEQYVEIPIYEVKNPIWARENEKFIILLPFDGFRVSYSIDFNHDHLRPQSKDIIIDQQSFVTEIVNARTFGFYEEVEYLKKIGLARGGSLDNAVCYSNEGLLNDMLRYEDECVRHKILDLLGDLALLGVPIKGHVIAYKSGHALDVKTVCKIKEQITLDQFSDDAVKCKTYLEYKSEKQAVSRQN